MKKRLFVTSALLVAPLALLSFGLRAIDASSLPGEDNGYVNIAVLTRAMQLIRQDYVDDKKTSYRALTYAALRGMFNSLDPHSDFMDPSEMAGLEDDTKSEFSGLGVTITVRGGVLTIVTPMEDTPSFKAGILPGDQILRINGESTDKMELSGAIDRLRGQPGEAITLTIMRPATKEIKDFPLVRAVIKVQSVKDARILDPETTGGSRIGYVRITQFSEPTAKELAEKLDFLEKEGMDALVLDLRNNPGGLLESAVNVCGQFLPPNTMVVYTDGRVDSQRRQYKTAAKMKERRRFPLAVLINGGSASGSEIVAGALKDLNRAVVVGETSFGKGSVQSVIGFMDNSGARITTAKYYTPSKQVIHEKGVAPQIRATMTPEQGQLLFLARQDYIDPQDRKLLDAFRDTQLERAVDALKGTMIYLGAAANTGAPTGTPANTVR